MNVQSADHADLRKQPFVCGLFLFWPITFGVFNFQYLWSDTLPEVLAWVFAGISFAQPALVAILTAYSGQPFMARVANGLGLITLLAMTETLAISQANSGRLDPITLGIVVIHIGCFTTLSIVMMLVRLRWAWAIVGTRRPNSIGQRQFPLVNLAVWTAWAAVIATAVAWFVRHTKFDPIGPEYITWYGTTVPMLKGALAAGVMLGSMLNVPWVLCDVARPSVIRWRTLGVAVELVILSSFVYLIYTPSNFVIGIWTFGTALISLHLTIVLVLFTFRAAGYRLVCASAN